ncbi:VWA domain-containing protein [Actinomadura sp. WMMB 499]|uniref:vWA domain-containing protein n=1 Tax=Actinomadura sp. WMMB 499 TaxID=1219491 RepID=UPI001247F340|nr:VWA domain-containing protein [Actinomadura sp. WMMB 499]QFG21507.1 VWA domain-containing protein [Actinomadura sp. WMMB 499]
MSEIEEKRRQVLYWRLMARLFEPEEQPALESSSVAIVNDLGLPPALLDPGISVDNLVQRFPDLAPEFRALADLTEPPSPEAPSAVATHTSTAAAGTDTSTTAPTQASGRTDSETDSDTSGSTPTRTPTAEGEERTTDEPGTDTSTSAPTQASGRTDGETDGETSGGTPTRTAAALADGRVGAGAGDGAAGAAFGAEVGEEQVRRAALMSKLLLNVFSSGSGPVSATGLADWQQDAAWLKCALGDEGGREIAGTLSELEGDLVRRMALREVLADSRLAGRLSPSMSLIEQLLRDKANLSGVALANAKALIRRFVDEVAEVLRTQVQQTSTGVIDRSVPPKRVFRNLDIDRTIWKNLPNWSPEDERLYVDKLFYKRTAKRTTPAKMIVVVDQSGSMVDAMVNCTILASIFAGLPKVDVHLVAYDTRALDLTPWVHDPFEVLLRTRLGGGTDGRAALELARPKITDPRNTVVVWISDFYEWAGEAIFAQFEAVHRSGAKFIPVGSVNSSGSAVVNPWFRERFKGLGTPVISGRITKLVAELKNFLA